VNGRGGAQRVVVRRNTIDGAFNGVGTGYNEGFDRYSGQDMDVYENALRHIADDALEPEMSAINFRAWNNRIEESLTVLSTGPVRFGPLYLFRNLALRIGNDGIPRDGEGRVPGPTMFKYSGQSRPPARVYAVHNTFWTDRPGVSGGAQYASSGYYPEQFWLRNNVIRATRYAFEAPRTAGAWDEDANYFGTTDAARGLSFKGVAYRNAVQAYRDASGQGARTQLVVGAADRALIDPDAGDVRLSPDSPLVDAGVPVSNLSDRPGIDFQGAAPDIGAIEWWR
jgi:hypothetical protein